MAKRTKAPFTIPCFRVEQSPGRYIYVFSYEGKLVPQIAAVSRIGRDAEAKLTGYQRSEQRAHIAGIREYVEVANSFIPNAIVICFDGRVRFKQGRGVAGFATPWQKLGTLTIPTLPDPEDRPGFIVDGQQRVAAVREARVESYPLPIVAFITDDPKEQREQFILVNSSKPLQRGLLHELAPHTEVLLPAALHRRRQAATLVERLNHTEDSPLHHMIRTPTAPGGCIRDNSMLRMLDNSLSEGALRHYVHEDDGDDQMYEMLCRFWSAVATVFEDAWGLSPRQSRLMHGAGVVSVGNLMDYIAAKYPRKREIPREQYFRNRLEMIADDCAWTSGWWSLPEGPRGWNELQNTNQDVEKLREFLQDKLDDRLERRRRSA